MSLFCLVLAMRTNVKIYHLYTTNKKKSSKKASKDIIYIVFTHSPGINEFDTGQTQIIFFLVSYSPSGEIRIYLTN